MIIKFIMAVSLLFLAFPVNPAFSQTITYPAPAMGKPPLPGKSAVHPLQKPSRVLLSLSRMDGQWGDDFTIHLTGQHSLSGCMTIGPLDYTATFKDRFFDIVLKGYKVTPAARPGDARQPCPVTPQLAEADIPLSVADLKKNNTKMIRFDTGRGLENYNIEITDDYIRLIPATNLKNYSYVTSADINGIIDPLLRWRYPENTIVLYAPQNIEGDHIDAAIQNFALRNGLIPLKSRLTHFYPPLARRHYFYYIDNSRRFAQDQDTPAGQITVQKKIYGLQDDEWQNEIVTLYARTPKSYE